MMMLRNGRLALRTACAGGALALLLAACGEPAPDAGDPAVMPPAEQQGELAPPAEPMEPAEQQGQVIEPAQDQQSMATGDELGDTPETTQQ